MPIGDHYATVAAFLPADVIAAVNAVIPNLLVAGSVLVGRAPRSREPRASPAFPAQVEIVYRGKRQVPVGTGWLEEQLLFDLIYTDARRDTPGGATQADRAQDVVRALQDRYHLRSMFAMAGLVRCEAPGPANVDENPGSSELVRTSLAVLFAFKQEAGANT